jgi:hypothetical protein
MDQEESVRRFSSFSERSNIYHLSCRRNFGLGRNVPFHPDDRKVRIHDSVKKRMEEKGDPYKPQARNWDSLMDLDMIKWVS